MRAVKRSLDSDEDLQLKPYSHYKPSAVKWLDDVPHHWEVRRFGTLAQGFNNGITADQLEIGESNHLVSRIETISKGAIDYTRVGYLAEGSDHQAYLLEEHDFLISHINSYARVGNSARHRGERPLIHGMNLIRITPFNAVVPSYLEYLLKSDVFIGAMRRVCKPAINQVSVTTTAIKAIRLPLPPLPEQAAIVRYLDHADRRIRRYVDAKRKLIALLEEEKQAIVNQAVTCGLDPNVPLKPSGVEWLGDVPEHWGIRRGKRLFSPRRELARPNDIQLSATQAYGVIPQDEYEQRVGRKIVKISLHLDKRRHVEVNDFVISMRSFQGGLERAWATGCIRSSYIVLRPTIEVNVEFFGYVLKSQAYIQALQSTADFIRDGQDLNFNNFCAVDLPFPPAGEQRKIAVALGETTANIDAAIARAHRQIELLQEYRTRIIADVVTGKVDVREAAAHLPDEADDGEPCGPAVATLVQAQA